MEETRKIIIIAILSIAGAGYGYSMGYLTLLQYYLVFGGLIIPAIGGYTGWTLFIRKAFSLHFQSEEGNHLREVGYLRIVSYDKDKSIFDYKKGGVLRQFWIDSRNIVYTDRFNKAHLFFPINNVFAFHPFAKTYSLTDAKDIPEDLKATLTPERQEEAEKIIQEASKILIPESLSPEEKAKWEAEQKDKKKEEKAKLPIGAIPIQFFTLMTVSAIEFAQFFSGKLIIARIEALRDKVKRNRGDMILGAVIGIMVGLMIGIVIYPAYTSHTVTAQTPNTTNPQPNSNSTNTTTTTTTTTTSQQSIPSNSTIIGQSSLINGSSVTSYTTYAHGNTTVVITHTVRK